MNNYQIQKRLKWIDVAKFMAIFAVMIDHTNGILYTDKHVAFFSYYSVSLFIIVMGITTIWSYSVSEEDKVKFVKKKCWGILRPYIVATVVYGIIKYKSFNFEILINHLIRFDMSVHFYYVLLYVQLVLVSPILLYILERTKTMRHEILVEIVAFLALTCISVLTTNFSDIYDIYGGGGKIFGGTFIILFYLGMWFGKYYERISIPKVSRVILSLVLLCSSFVWWRFISEDRFRIDLMIPFGWGLNPPSISLIVYSVLVTASLYFLNTVLNGCTNNVLIRIADAAAFLGKHTLYIYLYHVIFIAEVFPKISSITGIILDNVWIKRVVYFSVMILGSMSIEYVFEKIHKEMLRAYSDKIPNSKE